MNTRSTKLTPISIGQHATMACMLEVIAPKPGNVHRGADFEDVTLVDFAASAVAVGPVIDKADVWSLGELVINCVRTTRLVTETNTNLGLILLIAPLAKAAALCNNGWYLIERESVREVLDNLSAEDATLVYEAIRIANPGGLGAQDEHDVSEAAPENLIEAMDQAKARDLIARQYCNGYEEFFEQVVPWLIESRQNMETLTDAIIWTHVRTMAEFPDSLIARKCGIEIATQSAAMAAQAIESAPVDEKEYLTHLENLDFWLRADHNKRNPGTTADMVGAALFFALASGQISSPLV